MQQLTVLPKLIPPTSCSSCHSNLTSSTCSPILPRYVKSCTVSTSSHTFSSCSTASPVLPSHFQHVKFLKNLGVTILAPVHLLWINLPQCRHKTELVFTLKLHSPHVSTLFSVIPAFVMLPLTINLVFSILTFEPLLSKASFHFKNLFLNLSTV